MLLVSDFMTSMDHIFSSINKYILTICHKSNINCFGLCDSYCRAGVLVKLPRSLKFCSCVSWLFI